MACRGWVSKQLATLMSGGTFPPFGRLKSFYRGNLWPWRRISFLRSFSPQGLGKGKQDLRGRKQTSSQCFMSRYEAWVRFLATTLLGVSLVLGNWTLLQVLAWSGLGGGGAVHPAVFLSCYTPVSQMLTPSGVHRSLHFVVSFEPNTSSARVGRRTVQRMCAECFEQRHIIKKGNFLIPKGIFT